MSDQKRGFKITIEAEEGSLEGLVSSLGSLLERIEVSRQTFEMKMENERQKFDIVMQEKSALERQEKAAQITGLIDVAKDLIGSGLLSSLMPGHKGVAVSQMAAMPGIPGGMPSGSWSPFGVKDLGSDASMPEILTEFVCQYGQPPSPGMSAFSPPLDKATILRFLMQRGVFNRGDELKNFIASAGGVKNSLMASGASDEFATKVADMLAEDFEQFEDETNEA